MTTENAARSIPPSTPAWRRIQLPSDVVAADGARPALFTVWGAARDDVWMAGIEGTLLHWDGARIERVATGTGEPLWSLGGTGPRDVWAVGGDAILHYDGAALRRFENPSGRNLLGVWMLAPDDGWIAAADMGRLLRFDGRAWRVQAGADCELLKAIGASSRRDVWAGGDGSEMMHFDGEEWRGCALPDACVGVTLNAMWLRGDCGWAVGTGGTILRLQSERWSTVESPVTWDLNGVWIAGAGDVWAVGARGVLRWNGERWAVSPIQSTADLYAVWGSSSAGIWAVGDDGAVFHALATSSGATCGTQRRGGGRSST